MPTPLLQDVSWPGVLAVESLTYTASHGITPGVAILTTIPQAGETPAAFGDLVFGDGTGAVRLRDCKVDKLSPSVGPGGTTWVLTIFDRRWRWRTPTASFGRVHGVFNETDPSGKLSPFWIRSPKELAERCLKAMGEKNYVIELPRGLEKADGARYLERLKLGENLPPVQTNVPVTWVGTPPAEALNRLVELLGCRLVFQPVADRVVITPVGVGLPLPEGPCEVIAATIDDPETPRRVGVISAPIRHQFRHPLVAVGREWDTSLRPIGALSFAPFRELPGRVQTTTIKLVGDPLADPLQLTLTFDRPGLKTVEEVYVSFAETGAASVADKFAQFASQVNAHSQASQVVSASAAGAVLTLVGKVIGRAFGAALALPGVAWPRSFATETELPLPARDVGGWEYCRPPAFAGVRHNDRLAREQALGLARETVFKYFRLADVGLDGASPIVVPGYGRLKGRHQLVPLGAKVEQVVPKAREEGGRTKGFKGPGIVPEFYNGTSRDAQPSVYGAVARTIGDVLWDGGGGIGGAAVDLARNTKPADEVRVAFAIDPVEQVVVFSDYVYANEPAGGDFRTRIPELTLETAFLVREADSGDFARWTKTLDLGGNGPDEWEVHEDIQFSYVAQYDAAGRLTLADGTGDKDDAAERADYYLRAMAAKYRVTGGETRQYIGIVPVDLDGLRQQATWSIGPAGPTTTASTNCEHSASVLPYPARRRAENLSPNASAALANLLGAARLNKMPDPAGAAAGILRRL